MSDGEGRRLRTSPATGGAILVELRGTHFVSNAPGHIAHADIPEDGGPSGLPAPEHIANADIPDLPAPLDPLAPSVALRDANLRFFKLVGDARVMFAQLVSAKGRLSAHESVEGMEREQQRMRARLQACGVLERDDDPRERFSLFIRIGERRLFLEVATNGRGAEVIHCTPALGDSGGPGPVVAELEFRRHR